MGADWLATYMILSGNKEKMLLACNIVSTQLDIGQESVSSNTIKEGQGKLFWTWTSLVASGWRGSPAGSVPFESCFNAEFALP